MPLVPPTTKILWSRNIKGVRVPGWGDERGSAGDRSGWGAVIVVLMVSSSSSDGELPAVGNGSSTSDAVQFGQGGRYECATRGGQFESCCYPRRTSFQFGPRQWRGLPVRTAPMASPMPSTSRKLIQRLAPTEETIKFGELDSSAGASDREDLNSPYPRIVADTQESSRTVDLCPECPPKGSVKPPL